MIGLDTNVLVRFLVGDDPVQSRRARRLVASLDDDERAVVPGTVLCELVWVLTRSYKFRRGRVAQALRQLAAARQLEFHSPDSVLRAISAFEKGAGDFADYLIREEARTAGCDAVATFDKRLLKEAGFTAP